MIERSAIISECTLYRYRLARRFGSGPTMMFIMVNPSTADHEKDDQTIKKCMGFAERAGFGRIIVGNKFAFRSTDVTHLALALDPIGAENDDHITAMMQEADKIVVGWGQLAKIPPRLRSRWKDVVRMADAAGRPLYAIGLNSDRHPKHPQMTGYSVPIELWDAPWFPNRVSESVS